MPPTKVAVLQCADTGPLESLVVMLESAGYQCRLPDETLRQHLRHCGCDTVLSPDDLVRGMGYEVPMRLPQVGPRGLEICDLYVDVKAHRNGPRLWRHHPRLEKRTLWYRINGGKPEHVIRYGDTCPTCEGKNSEVCSACMGAGRKIVEDCGDERDPPCPVLTPNLWYADQAIDTTTDQNTTWRTKIPAPWANKSYACWPPFFRAHNYTSRKRITTEPGWEPEPPVCLVHNLQGWGYGALIDNMRKLGVRCYGVGSPDGLVRNCDVPNLLANSLCVVHLKSSDAPGYALYESLAAACPLVVTRRLIWRNRMEEMYTPGETCLVFDRETHDALSDKDVETCTQEVEQALKTLSDRDENIRIGKNGQERLKKLMWSAESPECVKSFSEFMKRMFP